MARIRYLKPDFFKDEDIAELPHQVRIFYAGLWCYADRAGRLEDRPKRLKAEIFPYEDFDIEAGLQRLSSPKKSNNKPFLVRYKKDGYSYIQILQWDKHQKPHPTEKKSEIPPPNNIDLTVKEPLKQSGEGNGDGEGNGEGNGEPQGEKPPAENTLLNTELKKVFKAGFNIYALIGRVKKESSEGAQIPDPVLLRVCSRYWEEKSKIEDEWPWFLAVVKREWLLEQHNNIKIAPMASSIKEIMRGV